MWTVKKLPVSQTYEILDESRQPIAEVYDEQNAKLFAVAPELLALAERVARLNRDAGEIGPGMLASLVDEARAAIQKTL